MIEFIEVSVDDLWAGDRLPAPIFGGADTPKMRCWEAGDTITLAQLNRWRSTATALYIDTKHLSSFARFAENQLLNSSFGSARWLSRFGVALTTRLKLLKLRPEMPGLLMALRKLATHQSRLDDQMFVDLMHRPTVSVVEKPIYDQVLTASITSIIALHSGHFRDHSDVVYAAYLQDLGQLLGDSAQPTESIDGRVTMSILATLYPVSEATRSAILSSREHLDGSGAPYGCGPEGISMPARCLGLARFIVDSLEGPLQSRSDLALVLDTQAELIACWYDKNLARTLSGQAV